MPQLEQVSNDAAQMTDDEMNAALQGTEQVERPMGEEVTETPAPQAAAPATTDVGMKHTFTHAGKPIEATTEQLIKWAQMGYDYPQKMEQLNKQRQDFEAKFKPYQDIDAYAQQNPQWWDHVTQSWQTKAQVPGTQANPNDPVMQRVNELTEKLNGTLTFVEQMQQEKLQAQVAKEDQELDTEIKSIREKHSDLDWSGIDQSGYNLERRVLQFATENGIKKFEHAFKLYNHDNFVTRAEQRGKEIIGQDIQKKTKLGIMSKPALPNQGPKPVQDLKKKSYNNILDEIKEEFNITD